MDLNEWLYELNGVLERTAQIDSRGSEVCKNGGGSRNKILEVVARVPQVSRYLHDHTIHVSLSSSIQIC